MIITDFLERNARLYGGETCLVEINPSEERDKAVTWWDFNLIESASPDAPYRREISWKDFDRRANRFANLLLSRGLKKGTKVALLLMNCLEWLPIYFGVLKAGCVAVPMNYRYSSDEIKYCLDLADVEVLVFGPEFVSRMDAIADEIPGVRMMFYVGKNGPQYTEDCIRLTGFCSSSAPPVALDETDDAAIYFSSGTTGFPKAILHNHKALVRACLTEQNHHSQSREDVFLCIPPLYHTGAKMHWFGSLVSGSKAVLLRGIKPEWILRAVTEEKCTIVWLLVPWAQDLLDAIDSGRVDLSQYRLDQWRLMHIGAQPVPPSLIKRWMAVFPHHQYDTNYGLSESIGPGCVHLDAPTAVAFHTVASGLPLAEGVDCVAGISPSLLRAISLAAVFFGSMTYIGNGPNFMVKAIAEQDGIKMPSFFGYILKFALVVLLPVYIIVQLIFLPF